MDFPALLGVSLVCAMGAMSPGPSLAVVLRNTISGGRTQGVMTGIGHGIGFGIYALLAVTGLSAILIADESKFELLQWGGAVVLLWLSYNMLTYQPSGEKEEHVSSGRRGFVEGFMIAFLNPKILVFLVAVFSQFLDPEMDDIDRMIMASIAGLIDTIWYVLVATVLSGTVIIDKLRENSTLIDRMIGTVLLILAFVLISKSFL
ncbi:MAG TPA: LysE family translocator [Candidatus Poseidoniia archaeon]|jgi:threonine/homoserine/homoserine lactone efflux protein|nr:LysE family translocator [Candidatus Poseidoniia archaeon]|tara:strand:- start:579 stop:1190 length:612 start_codon:yes stop_codon:yes gene_type:complete